MFKPPDSRFDMMMPHNVVITLNNDGAMTVAEERTKQDPIIRVQRYETIVVGGGQAGLATGHELGKRDSDYLILDAEERAGDSWRNRWDSLRLFTPAKYSALPGMHFPAPPLHLPDKDEVADYLERYVHRFDLAVRHNSRVVSVERHGDAFRIAAGDARYEAANVVVATGPFQQPRVPGFAAEIGGDVRQLHSSDYRNSVGLSEGPVLVVGTGNSGVQIALELSRFHDVILAGPDAVHVPRRVFGRDVYQWLWPVLTRATVDTRLGHRLRARSAHGDPVIGTTRNELAKARIRRVGRVEGVRDGNPVVSGTALEVRTIIWCTGFTADYSWLHAPVFDDAGRPRHVRGVATECDGLYFVGLRFQSSMTSALLGGVGADAAFIAEAVSARNAAREKKSAASFK